jgi:Large polyvalent protein-associated domain 7
MNTISEGRGQPIIDASDPSKISPQKAFDQLSEEIKAATVLRVAGSNQASRNLSSIDSRSDLRIASVIEAQDASPVKQATNLLTVDKDVANQWAALDARDLGRIRSEERKSLAIDVIAGNMRASPDYAIAMTNRSPLIAQSANALNQEIARLEAEKQAQLAQSRLNAESEARAAVRMSLFDAAALASVAKIRAAQVLEITSKLRIDPDPVLGKQDIADAQKLIASTVNKSVLPAGVAANAAELQQDALEKLRILKRPVQESELPQAIRSRFIVSAEKSALFEASKTEFTFRSGQQQGRLAFYDSGKQLVTTLEDKATITSMLEVAKVKNWNEITVTGSDDFRRQAWLEARLTKIEVRGYEPKESDKKLLLELEKTNLADNRITTSERDKTVSPSLTAERVARQNGVHLNGDDLSPKEKAGLQQAGQMLSEKGLSKEFSAASLEALEKRVRGERVYSGEVVDFGAAPYQFKKENDNSYFVTLKTQQGEVTVWGKGIEEPLKTQNVQMSDAIALRNTGKKDVVVTEKMYDSNGTQTGVQQKDAILNAWKVESISRANEQNQNKQSASGASALDQDRTINQASPSGRDY